MNAAPRLLRRAGRELVFGSKTFADALASLPGLRAGSRSDSTIIFRPRTPRQSDLEALAASVPMNQFCQIGYLRESRPSVPLIAATSGVTGRRPASRAELRYALTDSFIRHFAGPWKNYLGDVLLGSFLDILITRCTPGRTTLVFDTRRMIGMVSIFPESDCLGRPLDQVAWVWVERSLGPRLRAAAHDVVSRALATTDARRLQAGVHIKNIRSQRFFTRLGFKPTCLHCPPPRH